MLNSEEKRRQLKALADLRKAEPSTSRYKNLSEYDPRHDEHNHVSPVTKGASNVDSNIVIVLQDWTSTECMENQNPPFDFSSEEHRCGYTPNSKTFRVLRARLKEFFPETDLDQTYITNLFPFIKYGKSNALIADSDLLDAAKKYALPQIQIVRPILVIALGINAFWGLSMAMGEKKASTLLGEAANGPPVLGEGFSIWCQRHPAADIAGTDDANWKRMASWYREQLDKRSGNKSS